MKLSMNPNPIMGIEIFNPSSPSCVFVLCHGVQSVRRRWDGSCGGSAGWANGFATAPATAAPVAAVAVACCAIQALNSWRVTIPSPSASAAATAAASLLVSACVTCEAAGARYTAGGPVRLAEV